MENIAIKNSWNNIPMDIPKKVNILKIAPDLKLFFSEEQYLKLKIGLIPKEMEDKWFIYYENDWLHFHRSWTGHEIFHAEIIKENCPDGEYTIKDYFVERNKEYYNNDNDEYDLNVLLQLIIWGLLGIDIRNHFFDKYDLEDKNSLNIWSDFGRLMYTKNGKSD